MANSKARSNSRPASAKAGKAAVASRSARTAAAVSATPSSRKVTKPTVQAAEPKPAEEYDDYEEAPARTSPPLWLQLVSFVLAILGLAISAYETWAHFNGSHLAGCSIAKGSTFNCTAVITSPQSMVFGVIPVAVLGLAFYVAAVPLFSPWAWRLERREIGLVRLASAVIGMGFVMYLIYAEIYQIKQVCEYCSGVHIVTFLLFCVTVFSAAIWGVGARFRARLAVKAGASGRGRSAGRATGPGLPRPRGWPGPPGVPGTRPFAGWSRLAPGSWPSAAGRPGRP